MAKHIYKKCSCGGYPTCWACKGSGKVRDPDAEVEYAEMKADADRDDRGIENYPRGLLLED